MNIDHEEGCAQPSMTRWRDRKFSDIGSYTLIEQPALIQEVTHGLLRTCMIARLQRVCGMNRFRRVVDLGCAAGDWAAAYLGIADSAVGVDICPAFIEEGIRKYGAYVDSGQLELVVSDMASYADYEGADLVCSGGCFMCLDDDALHRLLARCTEAVQGTRHFYFRATVASPRKATFVSDKGGHYRRQDEYEAIFRAHGMKVLDVISSVGVVIHEILRLKLGGGRPRLDDRLQDFLNKSARMKQYVGGDVERLNWTLRIDR